MLRRVNEKLLKLGVVAIGVALTIGLFWTAPLRLRMRERSIET